MIDGKFWVSDFNFLPHVTEKWSVPKRVYVTDETLREGEETPGAVMSVESKLKIAQALEDIGVYETNVGYVSSIEDHAEFSRRLNKQCPGLKTSAYIRVYGEKGDFADRVKYAIDTGVDRVAVLAPASEYQFNVKSGLSKWRVFGDSIECVQKAKNCGVSITFAPYDTTRTDLDYLLTLLKTATAEGADRVLVYDTLGVMNPQATFYWITEIKRRIETSIQYHCHNDFGLAVANTCSAVIGGVEYIDIVVNGLGDRAGNANFEETVLALEGLYKVDTGIDTTKLFQLCKLVEGVTQIPIPQNKPLSGLNTFIHESDIHVAALLSGNSNAFEPYEPQIVGQERTIYFGSTTSIDSVETLAKMMNLELSDNQVKVVMDRIKEKVEKEGFSTDKEVRELIRKVKS